MRRLLLDASVILAAFDTDDDHHEPARLLLGDPEIALATLDLARYEVANVVVRAWRRPALAVSVLEAVARIGDDGGVVAGSAELLVTAATVAEKYGISVYDAAYVAAARQRNCPLVSCDVRGLLSKQLAIAPMAAAAGV